MTKPSSSQNALLDLASKLETRWRIINTWNGGTGGLVVEYTSKERGSAGHNECFEWIIKNKPFSFHEAITNQGYKVEPLRE